MERTSGYSGYDRKHTAVVDNYKNDENIELPCEDTRKVLAVLGALPCILNRPYWPSLNLIKSSIIYSIVVYSIMTFDVVWSVIVEKQKYDETDPSDIQRTQHLEHILAMLPHLLGVNLWWDVSSLSLTMEGFNEIQIKFRIATGKTLKNRRKRRERTAILASVCVLIILFILLHILSPPDFRVDDLAIVAIMYGNILAICSTFLWIGLSWRVYDAASCARVEFERNLKALTPAKVYNYRILWLSLRNVLDSMGRLQAPATVYSLGMIAVVVLFYEAAVLVQYGEIIPALGHFISGTFYVGLVALICGASHSVQQEMKCLVGHVLPKIALTSYDIKIQREIVMLFLVEGSRPAVTNMKGFILVNKNLILSFFSNISTYIIVLVQFSQKGDSFGM